jgi:hypothetical protein
MKAVTIVLYVILLLLLRQAHLIILMKRYEDPRFVFRDPLAIDPRTGMYITQDFILWHPAAQNDNMARFVTGNATRSVSNVTYVKVIAYPPNITFVPSEPILIQPRSQHVGHIIALKDTPPTTWIPAVVHGQVKTANNRTSLVEPSRMPLPPGTPIP